VCRQIGGWDGPTQTVADGGLVAWQCAMLGAMGATVIALVAATLVCGCNAKSATCDSPSNSSTLTYDCSGAVPDAGACEGGPPMGGPYDDQPHAVGCSTTVPDCTYCSCAAGSGGRGAQWECPL
jgi:hypothetical protein